MDYTKSRLIFKLKKTLRYVRLYGVRRTLVKVRGQYHMKRKFARLPAEIGGAHRDKHVGLIGCGNFAYSNIAYYLKRNYGDVLRGCMDIQLERAASLFEDYKLSYYGDDATRIIQDPNIDLVFIASNHASHAEYAIDALEQGKSVHVEKPHVVNEDQLVRLCAAMRRSSGKVTLGFNRPYSKIGRQIKRYLDGQSGPGVYNWFIAGHEIPPDHWYFREEEGGRVLGNLCHWTDFVYQLVPPESRFPVEIIPIPAGKSLNDMAAAYSFADGTAAVITLSAKGNTFEGVRERFSAQRGDALINMEDFKKLVIEVVEKKYMTNLPHRDHGHEATIRRSYEMVKSKGELNSGCSVQYVWETGMLFLKTKEALERNRTIVLSSFDAVHADS
ncbi:MAG TPA: Gfo/Idh/MocA family oxidoreductase [Candidatus Angelobacter sp.]|nr:Gfo/Idh/MocA family oxidoreductase [Candidatus Angelobacter sp.]